PDIISGDKNSSVEYQNVPTLDRFFRDPDSGTPTTVPAYAGPFSDVIPQFFADVYVLTPVANDKSSYEQAVVFEGNDITFKLKKSVPDFNFATTLGFGAVPNPVDH